MKYILRMSMFWRRNSVTLIIGTKGKGWKIFTVWLLLKIGPFASISHTSFQCFFDFSCTLWDHQYFYLIGSYWLLKHTNWIATRVLTVTHLVWFLFHFSLLRGVCCTFFSWSAICISWMMMPFIIHYTPCNVM